MVAKYAEMDEGGLPPIDFGSMFALLQAWDTDGDGLVSSADFKQGLSSIGFQISEQDADVLCRALDADGAGNIKLASLAELLEAPQDGGGGAVPPPPPVPVLHSMAFDDGLGGDAIGGGPVAPELRAWEALAAADPAAAAEAIAALPDDQAQALHMALGAAAAAAGGAPTGAPPAHYAMDAEEFTGYAGGYAGGYTGYEAVEDEPDDETILAVARNAHRAMEEAGMQMEVTPQALPPSQMPLSQPQAEARTSYPAPTPYTAGATPYQVATPCARGSGLMAPASAAPPCALSAPADGVPGPGPGSEYGALDAGGPAVAPGCRVQGEACSAMPADSAPAPPMMRTMNSSASSAVGENVDMPEGSYGGGSVASAGRRRSFGSLAKRFSTRGQSPVRDSSVPHEALIPQGIPADDTAGFSLDEAMGGDFRDGAYGGVEDGVGGGADSMPPSGAASEAPPRPMSRTGSVTFSEPGLPSGRSSFAQLSRLGSRSSLSVSFEKRESLYRPQDVATLPQKLGELLLSNHARAVDLFRAMDSNSNGTITREEFARCMSKLGLLGSGRKSPSCGMRSKSPTSGRDYEREMDELFATFDVNGDGSLDYEELHRLLRVGQASRMSEYLRASVAGKSLPPQLAPGVSYEGEVAKPRPVVPRPRDPAGRSGPGIALPIDQMAEVNEDEWPPILRGILMRERARVVDLFRHWEGVGEGGRVSAEHFKAGLFVLGHRVPLADVEKLYAGMGVPDGGMLKFSELRRQVRVIANRACSDYLRGATRQGLDLESNQGRGALLSGVADRLEQTPVPSPHHDVLAALTLASTTHGAHPVATAGSTTTTGGEQIVAASPSRTQCRGGLLGGISCSSAYSEGVVGLGADASSGKERALVAATEAAEAGARGSASLLASEMWVQQWARAHYSALLPELRKWELYPEGCIGFEVFADSLHNLGFPASGRWAEVESVWYSWNPDDRGRLQWNIVRNRITGGRMVRVQATKHNTVSYYKQASRAGEGFGNRSGSRFHYETTNFVGPGKYSPAAQGQARDRTGGGGHSGKLKSTAPRFLKKAPSEAPGPGKYTPRHTLTDGRTEIPPAI